MNPVQLAASLGSGEMPQELAKYLFENGATLILKDFPTGTEFGIDYKSWKADHKFLGMKMIPPGVHFVYAGVKDAPRIGFWHCFKEREIVVRKWDKSAEDFADYVSDELEVERIRGNLRNLNPNLGPYPYANYRSWTALSSYITEKTIERLRPDNLLGRITSQAELVPKEKELEQQLGDPLGTSVVDRQHRERTRFTDPMGLPVMSAKPGCEIKFTEVPQISLADTNLKKAGIDSSERFTQMLSSLRNDYKDLLAEFQYAFVVFLMGQVFEAYDQWKRIIHLVCSCTSALRSHAAFFKELMAVIHFQLKECPEDFFHDALAKDNFLASTLSLLFANIEDTDDVSVELKTKATKFKALLAKKFNTSFDLPDD